MPLLGDLMAARGAHAERMRGLLALRGTIACGDGCRKCENGKGCCSARFVVDMVDGLVAYRHLVDTGRWSDELKTQLETLAGEQCVFLGAGHRCTIYPARPAACGAMWALEQDGALVSGITVLHDAVHVAAARAVVDAYQVPDALLSLPQAVLAAERLDHDSRTEEESPWLSPSASTR